MIRTVRISIIALLVALCFSTAIAKERDYSGIDAYAKATPETKAISVKVLSAYLIVPAKNDSDKVRSIFTWMTSHITYDWVAYKNGTYKMQEPDYTLKRRKGVCQNFSDLFTALCNQVGIEAQTISGYAKSNVNYSWMLNGFQQPNHAWNVVKVSGRWQLMDVTWAQNTGDNTYFMSDPVEFRKNHLPDEPQWQLSKDTMKLVTYENMPVMYHDFNTVTNPSPRLSCIKGKRKVVFEFDCPEDLKLKAVVRNFDRNDKSVPKLTQTTVHTGNHYKVEVLFNSEKMYWVDLGGDGYHQKIATYIVDTRLSSRLSLK